MSDRNISGQAERIGLLIPKSAISTLSLPDRAFTDGSSNPELVTFAGVIKGRDKGSGAITIPLDAATAAAARKWLHMRQFDLYVLSPSIGAALIVFLVIFAANGMTKVALIILISIVLSPLFLQIWRRWRDKTYMPMQVPKAIRHRGLFVGQVLRPIAIEVIAVNPSVTMHEPT